ncbi:hypothetical protein BJ170DRAFT_411340 [Xylariales sp. AK1849]|nr:hypothetical protein BJ170DRAFT_411340 [Xylariales sp. AK1849]
MSRSGFNIRRLISQRGPRSPDEAGDVDSDDSAQDRRAGRETRKESWFSTRRPQSRKRPPTPIIISRPQSLHNVLGPLPPLPGETPRSSASSVCSCEKHGDFSSPRFAGLRRSPLCSISPKEDLSDLSLQVSSVSSYGGDDSSPHYSQRDKVGSPRFMNKKADPSGSKLDLMEALSTTPEDKGLYADPHDYDKDITPVTLPDNVQRLIQEADEAFRAVGSDIAEVNTRQSFNETPRLPPLNTKVIVQIPTLKPILKKTRQTSQPRLSIPSPTTPQRSSSVPRTNRRKSKQMKPQQKALAAKNTTKKDPRRTMKDNVSELFSGKLFNKIEADEMLTPSQIEAYKLRRLSKLQVQATTSSETLQTWDTESTGTPVEPFHLDDLPSRIGSSGVKLTVNTPVDDEPAFFNDLIKRDFSLERDEELFLGETSKRPERSRSPVRGHREALKNMVSMHPSMKSPGRYIFRKTPELPTISETALQDDELFFTSGLTVRSAADAEYVFFRSSPFSVTAPRFRHGPIRLAKSDLYPDPKLGGDDGLDWTAFQMAILGGAGDYFTDSEHIIRRQEAEDIEALQDWWDEWHFKSSGGLITQEDDLPSPISTLSGNDPGDYLYSEIRTDNPYSPHHKWQRLRHQVAKNGRILDFNLASGDRLYDGGGIKKWNANGHGTMVLNRESLVSMPQSPMLDLQVIRSDNGDVDYIPMGYNLSHDLGDFLNWEAEHVYSDNASYDGGVM